MQIPTEFTPDVVYLRHTETFYSTRRDFRWVRQENNRTEPCKWPSIHLPVSILGADCLDAMWWTAIELKESAPGVFVAEAPQPKNEGHWTGYYIEMYFPGDTDVHSFMPNQFRMTTPGFTWPNTLPFEDCSSLEGTCIQRTV